VQGLRVGLEDDFAAQRGLEGEQGAEGQPGDAAVVGMADAAGDRVAVGGAQDADRGGVPALDFKVDGVLRLDGYDKSAIFA
jgi:hypothetical protein